MKKSWLLVGGLALFLAACGDEEASVDPIEEEEVASTETEEPKEDTGLNPILENGIEEVQNWTSYNSKAEMQQEAVDGSTVSILKNDVSYIKEPLTIYNSMTMSSGGMEMYDELFLKDGVTYAKNESGQWQDANAEGDDVTVELSDYDMLNKLADLMQSYVDFSTKIEEHETEFSFQIKPENSIGVLNAFYQYLYSMDFEGNLEEVESVDGQILHNGSKITGLGFYATLPDSMGGPKQNLAFSILFSKINDVTEIQPEGFN